jgi:hypothetical protein
MRDCLAVILTSRLTRFDSILICSRVNITGGRIDKRLDQYGARI